MRDEEVRHEPVLADISPPAALRDKMVLGGARRLLGRKSIGALSVTLPSGYTATLGRRGPAEARLELKSYRVVGRALTRGALGFAEAYMRGEVDTQDLNRLIRYFIHHHEGLAQTGGNLFRSRLPDRLAHRMRRNTRRGSRRNISAHYDLGNEFYALWLDPGMTYSSGLYTARDTTLGEAQAEKYRRIVAALDVQPGHRVLEIGCGWGGMAEALARAGAQVTAITVSAEQHAYATARIAAAGLADRVEIRFQDYRDVSGEFDRIVSVEMIEAVGEEHWDDYFATLRDRLVSGGIAVLQGITIRERDFESYRRRPDFIQRYIFPGGMLPTVEIMRRQAADVSLSFDTVHSFGHSYARTLADWRQRFDAAWPRIAALGFDERFRRMWEYYLVYCEEGFAAEVCDVGIYRLEKHSLA